jgi:hypothetical protein
VSGWVGGKCRDARQKKSSGERGAQAATKTHETSLKYGWRWSDVGCERRRKPAIQLYTDRVEFRLDMRRDLQ